MHDAIDTAFMTRWQAAQAAGAAPGVAPASMSPAPEAVVAVGTVAVAPPQPSAAAERQPADVRPEPIASPPCPAPAGAAAVVERLLAAAWSEWNALAVRVEDARLAGRRVIAVAGSRRGEGRTTLVDCLAATLRARGREVVCVAPDDLAHADGAGAADGPGHDRRIVLLDAGVWFPPGPLHRQRLMVASLGVDAAILVRRADVPGGTARRAALEALGVDVLGEVLTFTPTDPCDDDALPGAFRS
jgi:hypothetical protein